MTNLDPGPAPAEHRAAEEPGIDIWALWRALYRRRWFAIGALLVCLVAGAAWTARSPRIYQAKALLLIEMRPPQVLNEMREVYDLGTQGYWSTQEYYKTQYSVIQSRPTAERAVANLGLSAPALAEALRAEGPEPMEATVAGDPLKGVDEGLRHKLGLFGLDQLESREAILEALETFDPVKSLCGRVQVNPIKDSRLVEIAIEDTNPERAALVANAIADAYIQLNLDQKIDTTRTAVDWLSDQMVDLKAKLEASEQALQDFKEDNRIVAVSMEDRRSVTAQTLMQLNAKLSDVRAERLELSSRIFQIDQVRAEGTLDELTEVIANTLIQRLKAEHSKLKQEETDLASRYTDEHPALIAVRQRIAIAEKELRTETDKVIASIGRQHEAKIDTERRLEAAIEEVKAEALELNKKEITFNRLLRERDNNLELYQIVLKRQKEADLARMLKVNNVRKLEAAQVPERPIRPRVMVNLAMALLLGIMSGIGLALGLDYLDNRIKSQEQIEQIVGLPFLGMIPAIKPDRANASTDPSVRDHFIIQNPRSSVAECCRTIRTNLLFMSPEDPVRSLLVTSGRPKEGKSTTVVNLGITMAQAGARVVLVDTDMRRPRLHKSFQVTPEAGISSVIVGEAELDQAIQPTGIDRLELIPCGPIPPNPAELLLTERFGEILVELSERYDRVLFDSPPIHAVTDALVLASMTGGVVLVARAGQTTLPATQQAKRRIEDVGGRIFGVVLNEVDLDRREYASYYDYYYHYRSDYVEEPSPDAAKEGAGA